MKFVLIILLCSNVQGNKCQPFDLEHKNFDTYHECVRYVYSSSAKLMYNMTDKFIDEYRPYITFSCNNRKIPT